MAYLQKLAACETEQLRKTWQREKREEAAAKARGRDHFGLLRGELPQCSELGQLYEPVRWQKRGDAPSAVPVLYSFSRASSWVERSAAATGRRLAYESDGGEVYSLIFDWRDADIILRAVQHAGQRLLNHDSQKSLWQSWWSPPTTPEFREAVWAELEDILRPRR